MLRVGLPKGVVKSKSIALIERLVGQPVNHKKLFHTDGKDFKFFLLKHRDIPCLIKSGDLDVGITSTEWIAERRIPLNVLRELDWCDTRISLIGAPDDHVHEVSKPLRCVTEFPNIATAYFANNKIENITLFDLSGSSEGLIPQVFDCCIDCVETGETLAEHNLVEWKRILESKIVVVSKQHHHQNDDRRLGFVLEILQSEKL